MSWNGNATTGSKRNKFAFLHHPRPVSAWLVRFVLIASILALAHPTKAQHLGVTCGWSYGNDLTGPYTGAANNPLFNPIASQPNATWDDWAEELAASGVDFVCPNLRGSWPETSQNPTNIAPLLVALKSRGLTNLIRLAIFDDNAASWTAQWNQAQGRGFSYAQPFDISQQTNWVYLWDYNYKLFYQTVPDANRFKINGRPVIIIWSGNTYFVGNMQGNASRALLCAATVPEHVRVRPFYHSFQRLFVQRHDLQHPGGCGWHPRLVCARIKRLQPNHV